jgi:hypothetical protein
MKHCSIINKHPSGSTVDIVWREFTWEKRDAKQNDCKLWIVNCTCIHTYTPPHGRTHTETNWDSDIRIIDTQSLSTIIKLWYKVNICSLTHITWAFGIFWPIQRDTGSYVIVCVMFACDLRKHSQVYAFLEWRVWVTYVHRVAYLCNSKTLRSVY